MALAGVLSVSTPITPGELMRLDAARRAPRHHRLRTPRELRQADDATRRALGPALAYAEHVLRLGDRLRLRLLFWDPEAEGCDWSVCEDSAGSLKRGLTLRFGDGPDGEQRAWSVLAALAASGART